MKAIWNGKVIAESDNTIVVEGNHYFPSNSVQMEYFEQSPTHTTCAWKGVASYYHVKVGDNLNKDSAWFNPKASSLADKIQNQILPEVAGAQIAMLNTCPVLRDKIKRLALLQADLPCTKNAVWLITRVCSCFLHKIPSVS